MIRMVKNMKKKKFNKFVKKVASDSKPVEHKKIPIIHTPPKWKMDKPQETGFVFEDFELIVDAEEK